MAARNKEEITGGTKAILAILLVLLFLPLVGIPLLLFGLYRGTLHLLICLSWIRRGKDVLFVSSESPIWRDYMSNEILPMVKDRAVVLNWSERKKWSKWSVATHAHRALGGVASCNPLVVVFRPFRPAKVFRFWPAFKDWKHGDQSGLLALRRELDQALSGRILDVK